MNDFPTPQEVFNEVIAMPAHLLALYYDLEESQKKCMSDIKSKGLTDDVFDEYAKVADKYGLNYVHPKYARGLRPVEGNTTLH